MTAQAEPAQHTRHSISQCLLNLLVKEKFLGVTFCARNNPGTKWLGIMGSGGHSTYLIGMPPGDMSSFVE